MIYTVADVDEYPKLFDAEVKRVLRTGRWRCGQHDIRHLSEEARQAEQQGRQDP